MFRRRKEKKTNYKKRLAMLKSGKIRLVIKRSLNYIHIQFIEFDKKGDKVLIEETSRNLKDYTWKAHCGNLPSAYLTGLMAGLVAAGKGIKEAILDLGLQTSVKDNAIYAAASGVKDAGVDVSMNKEVAKERIEGKHIAEYAKSLKKDNAEAYNRYFSDYIKKQLEPEKLPEHFAEVKENILKKLKKPKKPTVNKNA